MLTASHKWVQVIKLMSSEAKPGIAQQTANDIKMMMESVSASVFVMKGNSWFI